MKAIICTKYGNPDVLQIQEVPKPVAIEHEILVKIMSTAVNSGDVRVRGLVVDGWLKIVMRFVLGFNKPRKPIIGNVFSGIVEQVGNKVKTFKPGEEVFGMTGFNFGTYAEYMTISEKGAVIRKPENATFDEAAAIVFGGQTAIYFLEKAGIKNRKSPKVLIYGATGSVGVAAIQIAQHFNADITAVCSSEGRQTVESLMVKQIILYDKEDFTQQTERFDIILDAVGKTTEKQCRHLLKKDGVYKTVGGLDVATESTYQLQLMKELFENGKLKAVIDKTFSFDKVVDAHRYVDSGRKKGNVVLSISND